MAHRLVADLQQANDAYNDIVFHACRFGEPYQKPTRLRCWNWMPTKLAKVCTLEGEVYSCGRSKAQGHVVLEFGQRRTDTAAAYGKTLCEAWADALAEALSHDNTTESVLSEVSLTEQGRLHRHRLRGLDAESQREARRREDEASKAGMRNPANLIYSWPTLWKGMGRIAAVLDRCLQEDPDVAGLATCCGSTPAKEPPTESSVSRARAAVAEELGLEPERAELHHPASPWRFEVVRATQQAIGDPDAALPRWLEHGAPMGIAADIEPGGLFPLVDDSPVLTVEQLDLQERVARNHPSFSVSFDGGRPPGEELVEGYVEKGFGKLYASVKDASAAIGKEIHPAPMGTISKTKADGTWKHRVIQDLRRNSVNDAVRLPERQVLPRPIDHARDVAAMLGRGSDYEVSVLILDFKDAFMSIPLADAEKAFNCAVVEGEVQRGRDPLYEGEPETGKCIIWDVLGFGGKPNPLVYSRAASFAMRTGQAMFRQSPRSEVTAKAQLYVDDPAVVFAAPPGKTRSAVDRLLLWWLVLGIPLAWAKGSLHSMPQSYEWIGVKYTARVDEQSVHMELPEQFLEQLATSLVPFCSTTGSCALADAERVVGRAARVAHIVPAARPFVSGLWAALTACKRDIASGAMRSSPGRVPARRFATSACWVLALVRGDGEAILPLRRVVHSSCPAEASTSSWSIQFDASTTGGGAILRNGKHIVEYVFIEWNEEHFGPVGAWPGDSRFQTFWEFLMLLLSLLLWGSNFVAEQVAVLGDNTGSLQNAIDMKGRGLLATVARELAWRRARFNWEFVVGHVPSEKNVIPDALSRQFEPKPAKFPSAALSQAQARQPPDCSQLWRALAFTKVG